MLSHLCLVLKRYPPPVLCVSLVQRKLDTMIVTEVMYEEYQYTITSEDCPLGDAAAYKRVFADWNNFSKKHPKRLRKMVRDGVPNQTIRKELWERLTDCRGKY